MFGFPSIPSPSAPLAKLESVKCACGKYFQYHATESHPGRCPSCRSEAKQAWDKQLNNTKR